MSTEEDARKEYADAGVDLPEVKEEKKSEEAPSAKSEGDDKKSEEEAHSQPPTVPRKRSIYDDYKDQKSETKTQKERADQAERERDELQAKLDAAAKAETPEERKEAKDEIDDFIASHKEWDKAAINDLVTLARRGFKAEIPEGIATDLKDFQAWKADNAKAIETVAFNNEFEATLPALKELLPKATDDELKTVKTELEKLSHTKEFHDKPLDYIVFRNRTTLGALISPKVHGLEKKGRADGETIEFDFDPNADYSKLSPEEKVKWEAKYHEATKSTGLLEDAQGRKSIL